jgi:hypothetical protein
MSFAPGALFCENGSIHRWAPSGKHTSLVQLRSTLPTGTLDQRACESKGGGEVAVNTARFAAARPSSGAISDLESGELV